MQLSVVVPTLNARDDLAGCLDAIASHLPAAEVVVVNGPSADGTTGMVQQHAAVDRLVEIADRSINVARNAGIEYSSGDAVAFVDHHARIADGWRGAVETALADAAAVTGPTQTQLVGGVETETRETRKIQGRAVTYLNPGNVAFTRPVLEATDGFDEYLMVGGARDIAHRLAGLNYDVSWTDAMAVTRDEAADGGVRERDWGWKYRSLAYRLAKNYGFRPTVIRRVAGHAGRDGLEEFRRVTEGQAPASDWLGDGRDVLVGALGGLYRGWAARRSDREPRRNPRGLSARGDRAVQVHDL